MHPPRVTRRLKKSLTVRFPIPRAAAMVLRSMAVSKDPRLLELGVLAVKFKDDDNITLGLEMEKDPWDNGEDFREPAQRKSTSDLPHFVTGVKLFPSDPDRQHNTAGKHNNQDVIYAGNGLCRDNYTAAERKSNDLNARRASGETRSPVIGGIRPSFSREETPRKQGENLQSQSSPNNHSNGVPPGRILPPLPRRNKKERRSPGLSKSESPKRGAQPDMLNIFFNKGQFSAANMLMQLAKNHSSKEGSENEEPKVETSSDDSNKPVCKGSTNCPNKTSIVLTEPVTPTKIITQTAGTTIGSMMKPSSDAESCVPVLKSGKSISSHAHLKQNNTHTGTDNLTTVISQRGTASTCTFGALSHSCSSSFHSSPNNLVNSKSTPCHTASTLAETAWSKPSVLCNPETLQGSLKLMPKGSADTRTTWSNPSVRPHSHPNVRQTSKSNGHMQPMSGGGLCSGSPTNDQSTDMGSGVKTMKAPSSKPSSSAANVQSQLGLYQQNVARYPVGYFTYPLGFVYPCIAVPQGQASGQDKAESEGGKKEQFDTIKSRTKEEPVANPVKQELHSSTRTESRHTNNVQLVIPQVQAGNIHTGQFIDLASSLRYWQQLSLLYRNQFQVAAAQALAGLQYTSPNASSITSSQPDRPRNTKGHSDSTGTGNQDFNNNMVDAVRQPEDTNRSQDVELSRPSVSEQEKSHPVKKLNVHVSLAEFNEDRKVSTACSITHSSPGQHLWADACTTGLSEKLSRAEPKPGSPQSCLSSCSTTTSSTDDTSSPAPEMKEFYPTLSEKQPRPSMFIKSHGLPGQINRTTAPELSFVHENSIEYMNVRSHYCDFGAKSLKKSASRSEDGMRPAKRRKSKKSL